MAINDDIRNEMKADMTLTERICLYIPFYKGYRQRNLRRDEDRAVRGEMSRVLQGAKTDLATIQRLHIGTPLMLEVERIRTKVDRYDIDVKKAVNGYSGFHDSNKVLEDDLDKLVQWDARIFDDIKVLRETVEGMVSTGGDASSLIALERGIDCLIEDYTQREALMKGLSGE